MALSSITGSTRIPVNPTSNREKATEQQGRKEKGGT